MACAVSYNAVITTNEIATVLVVVFVGLFHFMTGVHFINKTSINLDRILLNTILHVYSIFTY